MKYYINWNGYDGIETIDTAETRKEAALLSADYNDAFGGGCYVSKRATKEWYKNHKED
jgi:hypothetical protein